MKTLIVDDNIIARTTLKKLASQVRDMEVVGECASGPDAYNFLQQHTADLLLLDIEMPGMTGVELVKAVSNNIFYDQIVET